MNACSWTIICCLIRVVINVVSCLKIFASTTSKLYVCFHVLVVHTTHHYISKMNRSWLPRVLQPDFIWTPRTTTPLSTKIPITPKPNHPLVRRVWGHIHTYLKTFSRHYCAWLNYPFDNQIAPLPFGLLLKWSDGTRLEEVLTTQVCHAAGLPTPRIICYGDHPEIPHAPVLILMTRLPGMEIGQVYKSLGVDAKATALAELKTYLATIRGWKCPWGHVRICSIIGGPIRNIRVPNHIVGPYETSDEFHDYLLAPARNSSSFASQEAFEEALERARKLRTLERPEVKLTHGD